MADPGTESARSPRIRELGWPRSKASTAWTPRGCGCRCNKEGAFSKKTKLRNSVYTTGRESLRLC